MHIHTRKYTRTHLQGVWLSKAPKVPEHLTLVMDLEGSDGRERGEDDTNFERQSALFALAVADVLMINIWSIEIGREHGSGKPLLRTIFQVGLLGVHHSYLEHPRMCSCWFQSVLLIDCRRVL